MKENHRRLMPLFGILLGGIVFFLIYGPEIVDPSFIGWTMKGDAAQHFLGWHLFRSEPWTFPPGVISSLKYPEGTSIVYTDSIPLLAFPLKILSPVLPSIFQYHGLWLLLCYSAQGFFAALLLRDISGNPAIVFISMLFFLLFPVMIVRADAHEALSGHWIILASLYLYFRPYDSSNKIKWSLLLPVSALVHLYLFAMAFVFFSAYILKHLLESGKKSIPAAAKYAIASMAPVILCMWLAGYFVITVNSAGTDHYGLFSMNLLAPVNPAPMKDPTFMKAFPLATKGQYEGFNYLGLGVLLLILISIYEISRRKEAFEKNTHVPLILACLVLFAFSISNKVTFAGSVLFEIGLPYKLKCLLGIFRSGGRMFWPVSYVLILFAVSVVVKYNSPKRAALFLFALLCIQIIDFFPLYKGVNYKNLTWTSPLQSDLWEKLAEKNKHIVFVPAETDSKQYIPFALLAGNQKSTINVAYTARSDSRKIYERKKIRESLAGDYKEDSLYIVKDRKLYRRPSSKNFMCGEIDGYWVVAPKSKAFELGSCPEHRTLLFGPGF